MALISDSRPSASRHQPKLQVQDHGHGASASRIVACLPPSCRRYQFILVGNRGTWV